MATTLPIGLAVDFDNGFIEFAAVSEEAPGHFGHLDEVVISPDYTGPRPMCKIAVSHY